MVEQTPGLWLIEACAGSGKSHLVRELARRHGCVVAPKVPVTHDRGDPASIFIDATDSFWDPASDEAAFLLSRPDDALTVIAARRIGPVGVDVGQQLGARWLRSTDLWFDDDELAELGASVLGEADASRFVNALRALTDAWPAAVRACLDEASRCAARTTDFGPIAGAAFNSVLDPALARLDPSVAAHLETLSFFERFDPKMAEVLGSTDLFDRLLEAGVPLIDDGRWASLGAVARAVVRSRIHTVPQISDELLDHLVANGQMIDAIESAAELGRDEAGAQLLAGVGIDDTQSLDVARTGAVVARLGAALDSEPRMYLVRARQHLSRGDLTNAIQTLRSGVDATAGGDVAVGVVEEMTAELAYVLYLSGDLDAARAHVPDQDFELPVARARQYQVVAGLDALTMEHEALERASRHYRIAERLWAENGQSLTAASVLTGLAMEVTSRLGRLGEAIALVERVLPTAAAHPVRQASVQLVRVRLLTLAGRHSEAEVLLQEVDGLVGIILRGWMAAHAHQARALMASHRGDRDEAARQLTMAERELGDLAGHAPGASLHCDAAEVFARVGDLALAREHLAALRSHPGAEMPDLLWAEANVECRVGDPTLGRRLAMDFRASKTVVPGGEWKLDFAESVAAERLGNDEESQQLRSAARIAAAAVGTPEIIEATEQAVADLPDMPEDVARCVIEVLGDFRVLVEGRPVQLPRGHGRTLLKLLALRSRQMTIDELIDSLWPDGDPAVGRRRLRNVLSRVRSTCGAIVDRDGDLVRLADDVVTDFAGWWDASVVALLGDTADLCQLSDLAQRAPDVLLPADRYEEWLQPLQQRYQLQLLRLLDAVAAAEEASIDLAIDAQRRALDIEPWSSDRIEDAIDLSRRAGRSGEVQVLEDMLAGLS